MLRTICLRNPSAVNRQIVSKGVVPGVGVIEKTVRTVLAISVPVFCMAAKSRVPTNSRAAAFMAAISTGPQAHTKGRLWGQTNSGSVHRQ